MADLYYADFSSMDVEELITKYKDKVDRQRLSKIARTQPPMARVRSLLGGYLLQVAIKEYLGIPDKESVHNLQYRYGEHGKPYLMDYPQLYFSLSHSGNIVALAVAKQEVGLDVQQHVAVKEGLAKRFFTEEENLLLANEEDREARERLFFSMWSIKESYIKFTGLGMSQGLDTFRIDFERKEIGEPVDNKVENGNAKDLAVFEQIELPGLRDYSVCICMKERESVCTQKLI